jgi:hypothetical protein
MSIVPCAEAAGAAASAGEGVAAGGGVLGPMIGLSRPARPVAAVESKPME